MGKSAGATSVGVLSGVALLDDLKQAKADHIIERYATELKYSIVAVSDTYRDNISDGYSIPYEIPTTLAFSSVNWCKIDVFTSNIMVLHHKMSQTV